MKIQMNRKFAWAFLLLASGAAAAVAPLELAKVNGQTITDKDLKSALSRFTEGQRATFLKDSNSKKQVLTALINREVLLQQAEKEKLDQDADFKEAISSFRKQYLSERIVQKNISAKINDAAAKKFYENNKSRFSTDQVQVQHILATDEAKARDLLKKAKEPNADFQALAEKYSDDPSAKNNRGDIGPITRDSPFVEEFKNAAFKTAEGEITGPVKTEFGYHLIKVIKKKFGRALNYEEVELRVKEELRQQLVVDYVNQLRAAAKVTVDDKALDKVN